MKHIMKENRICVKTKGNSSPRGKARVYLLGHPGDIEKHLEELCGDIFSSQNCAIYYEPERDGESDLEELADCLSDMQLIVVLVTTQFLFWKSPTKNYGYSYAVEHNIPILPIAVEEGIEDYFAEQMNAISPGYGDIQFLSRVAKDQTEIPYREKLAKKLETILVGDELAARVRAAFDAYIFMSYRKMDRSHAKELMSLIHSIPSCRDIAIWYDEFLIPGEQWNAAIAEMLEKSKLVMLVVTPNLLEKGNYIIEHEYPDAVKADKEIIPVEFLETDYEELSKAFSGIKKPIVARNTREFSEALRNISDLSKASENISDLFEASENRGQSVNEADAEHLFLMGLAYLGGIDVERNNERALDLIMQAAEQEFPEAIQKLVAMYNMGDGVRRDYQVALNWQERLIKTLEKTSNSLYDGWRYLALSELGGMYQDLGQTEKAKNAYLSALEMIEKWNEETSTLVTRRDLLLSHVLLGSICRDENDMTGAREQYEKALEISKQLVEETKTMDDWQNLSTCYGRIGYICLLEGDFSGAQGYYEKALKIDRKLVGETETVEARRALAGDFVSLGDVCRFEENYDRAQTYYEKGLEILKEVEEELGTVEARRDLSICYENLAGVCENEEDMAGAQGYYEKAVAITKELMEETGTVRSRWDFARNLKALGSILRYEGYVVEARQYYEEAAEICEQLVKEDEAADSLVNLADVYFLMGDLGDKDKLKMAYTIYCQLADKYPNIYKYVKKREIIEFYMKL